MRMRLALIIIIIILLSFSAGCWDYVEFEDMALVSTLGIDINKSTNGVTVTVEYMVPGGKGGSGSNSGGSKASSATGAVRTASGPSITDALTKIQQVIGKKLFYGYLETEVIGEDAAKYIMKDIMGYNDRTSEIRTPAYLTIVPGKAEDAVSTFDPDTSVTTGKNIHDLISQSNNTGNAFPVLIQDFIEKMAISGIEPVAPRDIIEKSDTSGDKEGPGSAAGQKQSSAMPGGVKKGRHKIDGIAVFRGDKWVGWLEGKESTGLAWIINKTITPYETVETSNESDVAHKRTFRVTKSKSNVKIRLDDGKPAIYINTYVEADLRKFSSNMNFGVLSPEIMKTLEKGLSDSVHSEIDAAIKKGQKELKSDIFGFGFAFYRQHPKLWRSQYKEKWADIFPDIPVNININAKVINTGTTIMKFFVK